MKFKGGNIFYSEQFSDTKQSVTIEKYESEKRDLTRSNYQLNY